MATLFCSFTSIIILIISVSLLPIISLSQPSNPSVCNGILISYRYNTGYAVPPTLSPEERIRQPYRFESTLTITNNGLVEFKNWRVFVGFNNSELLVSASTAVLADGTSLPADVSNGTVLAGYPVADLKTAVETAGDVNQMQARVDLVGTQFGVGPPNVPLPPNITLANDGYLCPNPTTQGNETRVCCMPDLNVRTNVTGDEKIMPLQNGDLTIMYDVIRSYESNYLAQVTISNHNPFARLDNWKLSWDWMEHEFINTMRGARPNVIDTSDCIFGSQGNYYEDFDFSTALSCVKRPTIIDLPLDRTNDTTLGMIPFCCRNGTILPPSMDLSKSKSAFQMQVYKMPPNLNKTQLTPPQNWKINSTVGLDYQCSPPAKVNPTLFPDPSGLPSHSAAIASWQVVCNITRPESKKPKCCVSFSAFFNDSVIPCNTCACGCDVTTNPSNICSAAEPPLLLPAEALLIPFENRTDKALEFADLKRRQIPNPLPCADNCGVSINWHVLTDYEDGWTARMTLFNWGESDITDWFSAVELDKAVPGFEDVYSFAGTPLSDANNTIFFEGLPGHSYLVAERNGSNPKKDPRLPGTEQSVISFTKKKTPGINVGRGDGFPTKVYFNGEECSLPTVLPSNAHRIAAASAVFSSILLMLLILTGMQQ
ncbi:COBRA-like protein 7 [Olea europaea var. sylvestris]|uniref:COBRA-like protein 7 n=1 Tax=Olea europaea var. sylvestris TaxID=158386 RepID=UPI000C1CF48A|nr:COBRA-like protein 7 [Olea europaea var. sylvestris]